MNKNPAQQGSFVTDSASTKASGPVECLGMKFDSDEERRKYFTEKLREKLKDPAFRQIEGFPIGSDEDILALSDPPYYTTCPNPFIEDFIRCYGKPFNPKAPYSREPFAADVSEGKNDPIYNAHSYHTKVPYKAIMRYILHYTAPEDIVFDGFCGTGMTGVAAQLCGDKATVEALGYRVREDGTILDEKGIPFSRLGARRAILNDLSPAATFIAYNYNTPVDVQEFKLEAKRILEEVEEECGWMYETRHPDGRPGRINYTVWSDVFICPECTREVVFWEAAVDKEEGKVYDDFPCPHCGAMLTKRSMERAWVTRYDKALKQTIRQVKQVPVLINYTAGGRRYEKSPDDADLKLIERIENSDIPYWFPTDRMPEGDESRRNDDIGLTHVHHFYTKRNLWLLADLFSKASKSPIYRQLFFILTSFMVKTGSKLHNIGVKNGAINLAGAVPNTLFIPSALAERNLLILAEGKLSDLLCVFKFSKKQNYCMTFTQSTSDINLKDQEVDYIFTDPPFGGNLMYSELNSIWEDWLRVSTNNETEAITNNSQKKDLNDYQNLMTRCFKEYYRVLKPGRWMTVEFHNSKNSVWNAIQEALQEAGFVLAGVTTIDKQQGTFNQMTNAGSVKQDLIISAYKPSSNLENKFMLDAGTEAGVWDFIREHLKQLPVFIGKNGQAEVVAERQSFMLYDRMLAFHLTHTVLIPLSAAEFYAGLAQKFPVLSRLLCEISLD